MNNKRSPRKSSTVNLGTLETCDFCKVEFQRFKTENESDLLSRAVKILKALMVRKYGESDAAVNFPKMICFTCCGSRIHDAFSELETQTDDDFVRIQLEFIQLGLGGIGHYCQEHKLVAELGAQYKKFKQQQQQGKN